MEKEYQKIVDEINATAAKTLAVDANEARKEQDARTRYELAMARKQKALDAGDREQYKKAGMAAEEARLDVEFFDKLKELNRTPGASCEDDTRIHAALRTEAQLLNSDALAQLKQIFTEASDVCASALARMTEIDAAGKKWDSVVMKKQNIDKISRDEDRLTLAQVKSAAEAQLNRFKLIGGN